MVHQISYYSNYYFLQSLTPFLESGLEGDLKSDESKQRCVVDILLLDRDNAYVCQTRLLYPRIYEVGLSSAIQYIGRKRYSTVQYRIHTIILDHTCVHMSDGHTAQYMVSYI